MELTLKYGCNPSRKSSRTFRQDDNELPVTMLNSRPGYVNSLDALNSWQLVKEPRAVTGLPAATPFKHVSPAGAAMGAPIPPELQKSCFADDLELSPLARIYARARGVNHMSSYGDWVALSDKCDAQTARLISCEVPDGIIASGYSAETLEILKTKRRGSCSAVQIDLEYVPTPVKRKDVFGIILEWGRNNAAADGSLLTNFITDSKTFSVEVKRDLLVALIMLKYIQSNSACYARNGQTIGMETEQQSHIHCTRFAGNKTDLRHLYQHPQILSLPSRVDIRHPDHDNTVNVYLSDDAEEVLANGVRQQFFTECPAPLSREEKCRYLSGIADASLGPNAFSPSGNNIEHAHRSGVSSIVQPGGFIRDGHVIDTCNRHDIVMVFTGLRLFHH